MIHSLFMINSVRDIFMEKHWKSVVQRSICEYFFDAQKKANTITSVGGGGGVNHHHSNGHSSNGSKENRSNVPVVIQTPHYCLIHIYRNELYLLAVTSQEIAPLFVIEFLHRVIDLIIDYFGDCTENIIKEHYVVVYELLDEMLDNGYPFATESNILKELIRPPNLFRTIANTMTGKTNVSVTLPSGQLSNVPWRRSNVKYANNEAYFDVIEEIDAILDKNGSIVSAEIQGYIDCCIKLSGMPDLSLSFINPRLFDDVSFHPCVRYRRWESERVLSFIPPDGNFRLMSYHIGAQNIIPMPICCKQQIIFKEFGGKLEIQLMNRNSLNKAIELVSLEMIMPKTVLNVNLNTSQGKYTFDSVTKQMCWDVGRMDVNKSQPVIKGSITLQSGQPLPDSNPTILIKFTLNQTAASGLKVNRLDMYGEKYKPFKGVKYITKAGNYQIRT